MHPATPSKISAPVSDGRNNLRAKAARDGRLVAHEQPARKGSPITPCKGGRMLRGSRARPANSTRAAHLPVFRTLVSTASASQGSNVRRSITSQLMPSRSATSLACNGHEEG